MRTFFLFLFLLLGFPRDDVLFEYRSWWSLFQACSSRTLPVFLFFSLFFYYHFLFPFSHDSILQLYSLFFC